MYLAEVAGTLFVTTDRDYRVERNDRVRDMTTSRLGYDERYEWHEYHLRDLTDEDRQLSKLCNAFLLLKRVLDTAIEQLLVPGVLIRTL